MGPALAAAPPARVAKNLRELVELGAVNPDNGAAALRKLKGKAPAAAPSAAAAAEPPPPPPPPPTEDAIAGPSGSNRRRSDRARPAVSYMDTAELAERDAKRARYEVVMQAAEAAAAGVYPSAYAAAKALDIADAHSHVRYHLEQLKTRGVAEGLRAARDEELAAAAATTATAAVTTTAAAEYAYPAQARQAYVDAYMWAAWATHTYHRKPGERARMNAEAAAREVAVRFPGIKISGETIRNAVYGVPPRPPGRQPYIPASGEKYIADLVRARRVAKFAVFKEDIMSMANALIKDTELEHKFEDGVVTNRWYERFLNDYGLAEANHRPLEIAVKR